MGQGKSSLGKILGIGCALLVVVIAIGAFMTKSFLESVVADAAKPWTGATPLELPAPSGTKAEADELMKRVNAFFNALQANKPAAPLELTGNEINLLFVYDPDLAGYSEKLRVSIEGEELSGTISLPLTNFADIPLLSSISDRYLNGTATFTVVIEQDDPKLFLKTLSVKGKALPDDLMESLTSSNILDDSEPNGSFDESFKEFFKRVKSVTVKDSKLVIEPQLRSK